MYVRGTAANAAVSAATRSAARTAKTRCLTPSEDVKSHIGSAAVAADTTASTAALRRYARNIGPVCAPTVPTWRTRSSSLSARVFSWRATAPET